MSTDNTQNVEINGHHYVLVALPATKGWPIATWLTDLVGGSIGHLAGGAAGGLDNQIPPDVIAQAVARVTERVNDPVALTHIKTLLSVCTRDEQKLAGGAFDMAYTANYGELLEAIRLVIQHNFASFFAVGPGAAAGALLKRIGDKLTQARSTGGSGDQ